MVHPGLVHHGNAPLSRTKHHKHSDHTIPNPYATGVFNNNPTVGGCVPDLFEQNIMREILGPSLGLNKGLRVLEYESVDELEADAKKVGAALAFANKYLREKCALVEGRDKFTTVLAERAQFPMLTKTVTRKNSKGEEDSSEVPAETEVKFTNRFRAACVAGEVDGWPQDESGIEIALQKIADEIGPFKGDATKPERVSKAKTPPQYATAGATQIMDNQNQAKWVKTFTEEGIEFEDFQTGNREADITALAWAIKAREDARARRDYA